MGNFFKFINDGGIVAWMIFGIGIFAATLIVDRVKVLYFDFALNTREFTEKIKSYIMADKIEEALAFCGRHKKAPVAYVIAGVLERADRDDQAINQALDIRYAEVLPRLSRRFGYLMMISNVATLMGLLGTIHGLIISFEAVSFADPAQKQTILTQGIAMYMAATATGLGVAIPVMFFYAFLHARQNALMNDIVECSSKVVDVLSSRSYEVFDKTKMYTVDGKMPEASPKAKPPAPTKRAS